MNLSNLKVILATERADRDGRKDDLFNGNLEDGGWGWGIRPVASDKERHEERQDEADSNDQKPDDIEDTSLTPGLWWNFKLQTLQISLPPTHTFLTEPSRVWSWLPDTPRQFSWRLIGSQDPWEFVSACWIPACYWLGHSLFYLGRRSNERERGWIRYFTGWMWFKDTFCWFER